MRPHIVGLRPRAGADGDTRRLVNVLLDRPEWLRFSGRHLRICGDCFNRKRILLLLSDGLLHPRSVLRRWPVLDDTEPDYFYFFILDYDNWAGVLLAREHGLHLAKRDH